MRRRLTSAVVLSLFFLGCGSAHVLTVPDAAPPAQQSELWVDPGSRPRDLFHGVGGKSLAPARGTPFKFDGKDELGFSVSYDVVGPDGVEWSAKIGPEAQTEVLMSRLLWGLGYHQPPVYYLPSWSLVEENGKVKRESEARFRPKLDQLERLKEYWSWKDNPFSGTRPLKGLLVVLLMLNSTDLKDDNNSIYQISGRFPPGGPNVKRWFVVRDLGAALGETGKLFPRRNWLEGFEAEEFITGFKDGQIEFAFSGRHQDLLKQITPTDLRWAGERMRRLTDQQWRDAFRAANYSDGTRDRYLRKIRQRIAEALEVAATSRTTLDD